MSGSSSHSPRRVQHLVEVHRMSSLSDHHLLERFATELAVYFLVPYPLNGRRKESQHIGQVSTSTVMAVHLVN